MALQEDLIRAKESLWLTKHHLHSLLQIFMVAKHDTSPTQFLYKQLWLQTAGQYQEKSQSHCNSLLLLQASG